MGGTCVRTSTSYFCKCTSYFTGPHCRTCLYCISITLTLYICIFDLTIINYWLYFSNKLICYANNIHIAVVYGRLYPYGDVQLDKKLPRSDDNTSERRTKLPQGFMFGCDIYRYIHVGSLL